MNLSSNSRIVTFFALILGTSSPKFAVLKTSGFVEYWFLLHSPPDTLNSLLVPRLAARRRFSHRSNGGSLWCFSFLAVALVSLSLLLALAFLPCFASALDLSRTAVAVSRTESAELLASGGDFPQDSFAWTGVMTTSLG